MKREKSLTVKELPESERPREKLLDKGAQALSDAELLAILFRTGSREESAVRLAERLLVMQKEEPLEKLANLSLKDFLEIKGIGMVKAVTVIAALELGKRLVKAPSGRRFSVHSPQDAANYMMGRLRYEKKEHFILLLLDIKNHILASPTVSIGGLSASIVEPREVFREALRYAAAGMILIHNHPSGDPSPSKEDILITKKLAEAGNLMDVKVMDHIIIGDNRYISMQEAGMMN